MTNAAIALDLDFPTISTENLDAVTGGVTREQAQNFGGQVAEVGAVAGGAAGGFALGGPGGAAAGAAAGEIANRTGASSAVGRAVGGAVLGNQVEKNNKTARSYDVRVRMEDNTFSTVRYEVEPNVRVGDKVRVEDGRLVRG